jgi:hypothetical protein
VLVAAGQHLGEDDSPTVVADSGVENVNRSVDATLAFAKLRRVLAQVEVTYSNSIIEAWWRSLDGMNRREVVPSRERRE